MLVCCPQGVSAGDVRQSGLHLNLPGFALPFQCCIPPVIVLRIISVEPGRGRLTSTTMPKTIIGGCSSSTSVLIARRCQNLKTKKQAEKARGNIPNGSGAELGLVWSGFRRTEDIDSYSLITLVR